MKWIGICVLIAVVALAAASTPTLAAPGGNGNGNGQAHGPGNGNGNDVSTQTLTATVFVEPNPADAWSYVRIKGCGYETDRVVWVELEHNGTNERYWASVFADGCFDAGYWTAEPGTYILQAFQELRHNKTTLMAEGTLEVQ